MNDFSRVCGALGPIDTRHLPSPQPFRKRSIARARPDVDSRIFCDDTTFDASVLDTSIASGVAIVSKNAVGKCAG